MKHLLKRQGYTHQIQIIQIVNFWSIFLFFLWFGLYWFSFVITSILFVFLLSFNFFFFCIDCIDFRLSSLQFYLFSFFLSILFVFLLSFFVYLEQYMVSLFLKGVVFSHTNWYCPYYYNHTNISDVWEKFPNNPVFFLWVRT